MPMRTVLAGVLALCVLGWGGVVGYIALASLPYSALGVTPHPELNVKRLVPEGWAFFTRNPREPRYRLYDKRAGAWARDIRYAPTVTVANLFGVRRTARVQSTEYALLLRAVEDPAWVECDQEAVAACLTAHEDGAVPLRNTLPAQTVCGRVALVVQEPIPWAWADSDRPVRMPAQALLMDVTCS